VKKILAWVFGGWLLVYPTGVNAELGEMGSQTYPSSDPIDLLAKISVLAVLLILGSLVMYCLQTKQPR
jgi:hypothetical protein